MAWETTVAGTLHLNDITTPHGRRPRILGGSAVYFTLAATPAPVNFYGIVGADAVAEFKALLTAPSINLEGLTVSRTPTFHWHAEHDFDEWVAKEQPSDPGCDAEWRPQLTAAGAASPQLFLGSMDPHVQLNLVRQSQARLIGSDSMVGWIGRDREVVEAVVAASDVLFLNRTELAELVGANDEWEPQAQQLVGRGRLRAVIVKGGPEGAALVMSDRVVDKPASPIADVIDPTGAGDALAGGFFAAWALAQRDDPDFFELAWEQGLRGAAAAISRFGTQGLRVHVPA